MQRSFASSLLFFLLDLLIISPVCVKLVTETIWLGQDIIFFKTLKLFWTLIMVPAHFPHRAAREKTVSSFCEASSHGTHESALYGQTWSPLCLNYCAFQFTISLHLLTFHFCCSSFNGLPLPVAQKHFGGNPMKYTHTVFYSTPSSRMNTALPDGKITTYAADCRQSVILFISPALCTEKSWMSVNEEAHLPVEL